MQDLWPEDLATVEFKAPVAILREQATLLGQKTRNLVEGRVREVASSDQVPGIYNYAFEFLSPALANYTYRLFYMQHGVEIYPVNLYSLGEDILAELKVNPKSNGVRVDDEAALLKALQAIFNTRKTRAIIQSLVAQSQGMGSGNS